MVSYGVLGSGDNLLCARQSSFERLCLPPSALETALQKPHVKPAPDTPQSRDLSAGNDPQQALSGASEDSVPPLQEAFSDDSAASGSVSWMQVRIRNGGPCQALVRVITMWAMPRALLCLRREAIQTQNPGRLCAAGSTDGQRRSADGQLRLRIRGVLRRLHGLRSA